MSNPKRSSFATSILQWHQAIDRRLPWKESKDPYKIWLSEIIMQQTRVAQGTPYYLKFIDAYPTIIDLANAPEDEVMKLWQGLGYYSRARNLHYTAKFVRDKYLGTFPTEYKEILDLKGVGKYTAAAIASFAYGLEYPVVDGNVIRVISRYFGITAAVDSAPVIKKINALAVKLIQGSDPADYNQAIMDFGALQCSPKSPNCEECPLNQECVAYETNQVDQIPFKSKKVKKRERFLHYLYISDAKDRLVLNFRDKKDIWQSLYDFPCMENASSTTLDEKEIKLFLNKKLGLKNLEITPPTKTYKHILSHQTIYGQFHQISVAHLPEKLDDFIIVEIKNLDTYAFPVLLINFMKDKKEWTLF
ncbi:MAG: A/G-specific adenine glycosylase [Bacteroidota bacterium]